MTGMQCPSSDNLQIHSQQLSMCTIFVCGCYVHAKIQK